MPFSYLPQHRAEARPSYLPDQADLQSHQSNRVTLEWLNRLHQAVRDQYERVAESTTVEQLHENKAFLKGLVNSLEMLETIADEIRSGELRNDEEAAGEPGT